VISSLCFHRVIFCRARLATYHFAIDGIDGIDELPEWLNSGASVSSASPACSYQLVTKIIDGLPEWLSSGAGISSAVAVYRGRYSISPWCKTFDRVDTWYREVARSLSIYIAKCRIGYTVYCRHRKPVSVELRPSRKINEQARNSGMILSRYVYLRNSQEKLKKKLWLELRVCRWR
jgi:hypothetical protein